MRWHAAYNTSPLTLLFPAAPQTYQVDWEAILSRSSEPFVASVSAWLYPPAARGEETTQGGLHAGAVAQKPARQLPGSNLSDVPLVSEVLSTSRRRLDALNA